MDLDSPLVWEEAKWSSTPSGRQIPHACSDQRHFTAVDIVVLPAVVQIHHERSAWSSGHSLTSGSCRDRRAAAFASIASTSPTGWISTATPLLVCNLRQQQLQQGEHLKKNCKLWAPTGLVPGDD